MKLAEIVKGQKQIEAMGHSIENNVIKSVDINTIAHFGKIDGRNRVPARRDQSEFIVFSGILQS